MEPKKPEVRIENGKVYVTQEFDPSEINARGYIDFEIQMEIKKQIINAVVTEILRDNLKPIIDKVLAGVNWPEVVRSEIAQLIIKEIANSHTKQY